MSIGQGFTVEPTELRTHGGTLERVADSVDAAADQGGSVSFGIDTFGIVGQLFAGEARRVSGEAVEELRGFAEDIRSMAAGVRAAGEVYQGIDDANRNCFAGGEG